MNKLCSFSPDCSAFPSKDCAVYLPSSYFALNDSQGPYEPLTAVYAFALAAWILMSATWMYLTFYVHRDTALLLCKFVSGVPLVKVLTLMLGVAFWVTCNAWLMCSYWVGVALMNVHLIYETLTIMVFLLVAKGWTVTEYRISLEDWRLVIILMSLFYMAMSIILVLENDVLSQEGFWVAVALVYGLVYYFVFINVLRQLGKLGKHVSVLEANMPAAIVGPLIEKRRMYVALLLLILCAFAVEVACHAIIAESGTLWKTLCVYEVSNVLIFLGIGLIFRPREHSPFFFMVPARMDDVRTRAIATIQATDDDLDGDEVELAPLIVSEGYSSREGTRRRVSAVPSSMVIIRNPSSSISVGVSAIINPTRESFTVPPSGGAPVGPAPTTAGDGIKDNVERL